MSSFLVNIFALIARTLSGIRLKHLYLLTLELNWENINQNPLGPSEKNSFLKIVEVCICNPERSNICCEVSWLSKITFKVYHPLKIVVICELVRRRSICSHFIV